MSPLSTILNRPLSIGTHYETCDLSMQCNAMLLYLICQELQVVVGRRYYLVCYQGVPVRQTG